MKTSTENNIIIRKAMPGDLKTLLHFEQEIIRAERPFDETIREGEIHYYDIEAMLYDPQTEIAVAEINHEIIASGYACIEAAKPFLKHKLHAHLGFMYVHPLYRGKGINNRIVERLTQFALINNVTELRLDVYDGNEAALKAYQKAGFSKLLIEMRKAI